MQMLESLERRTLLSFSAPVTSRGGGADLNVADFNQDGKDDVAAIVARNSVVVSLSNGDGLFRNSATLTKAKGDLKTIATADVNGDGRRDIVARGQTLVSSTPSNTYAIYTNTWLGKGDGTFGPLTTTQGTSPYGIPNLEPTETYADFNRDGALDRASLTHTSGGGVYLYLNNNDGTDLPRQFYPAVSAPMSITAGDFNGDGWTDLVVVNSLSSKRVTLTVLLNEGNW